MKAKSIKMYETVYCYRELTDLFEEHEPDFLKDLNEEETSILEHVLDFEDYIFMVVNYDTIITTFDNAVISIDTMEKFQRKIVNMIGEEL